MSAKQSAARPDFPRQSIGRAGTGVTVVAWTLALLTIGINLYNLVQQVPLHAVGRVVAPSALVTEQRRGGPDAAARRERARGHARVARFGPEVKARGLRPSVPQVPRDGVRAYALLALGGAVYFGAHRRAP